MLVNDTHRENDYLQNQEYRNGERNAGNAGNAGNIH